MTNILLWVYVGITLALLGTALGLQFSGVLDKQVTSTTAPDDDVLPVDEVPESTEVPTNGGENPVGIFDLNALTKRLLQDTAGKGEGHSLTVFSSSISFETYYTSTTPFSVEAPTTPYQTFSDGFSPFLLSIVSVSLTSEFTVHLFKAGSDTPIRLKVSNLRRTLVPVFSLDDTPYDLEDTNAYGTHPANTTFGALPGGYGVVSVGLGIHPTDGRAFLIMRNGGYTRKTFYSPTAAIDIETERIIGFAISFNIPNHTSTMSLYFYIVYSASWNGILPSSSSLWSGMHDFFGNPLPSE